MKNIHGLMAAKKNLSKNEQEALADVLRLTNARNEPDFIKVAMMVLMKWAERVDEKDQKANHQALRAN